MEIELSPPVLRLIVAVMDVLSSTAAGKPYKISGPIPGFVQLPPLLALQTAVPLEPLEPLEPHPASASTRMSERMNLKPPRRVLVVTPSLPSY
jgi:hypothetical protein